MHCEYGIESIDMLVCKISSYTCKGWQPELKATQSLCQKPRQQPDPCEPGHGEETGRATTGLQPSSSFWSRKEPSHSPAGDKPLWALQLLTKHARPATGGDSIHSQLTAKASTTKLIPPSTLLQPPLVVQHAQVVAESILRGSCRSFAPSSDVFFVLKSRHNLGGLCRSETLLVYTRVSICTTPEFRKSRTPCNYSSVDQRLILVQYGVPTPKGIPAKTAEEAYKAAQELSKYFFQP